MKKEIILILLVIINIFGFGQLVVKRGNQEWLTYINELKFSNKVTLNNEGGYRVKNYFEDRVLYYFRTSINYTYKKHLQFGTGISYFHSYSGKIVSRHEYRFQQEVNYLSSIEKIKLRQRIRIEERLYAYPNVDGMDFQFRFRFMSQALFPVAKFGEKQLLFSLADEFMLKSKISPSDKILDQNRILFGPVFKFSSSLEAKMIYNGQLLPYKKTDDYEYNSIYWLTITQKLSTKKYKDKNQGKS